MKEADAAELALLSEAILKATALFEELSRSGAAAAASPPDLPADQLAEGQHAMDMAVESAGRMLEALQLAAASHPVNGDQPPA